MDQRTELMASSVACRRAFSVIFIAFIGAFLPAIGLTASALLDETATADRSEKVDEWSFEEPEFLHVDEAFVLSVEVAQDGSVLAYWEIEDGYYLYRHRFGFSARVDADHPASPVTFAEAGDPARQAQGGRVLWRGGGLLLERSGQGAGGRGRRHRRGGHFEYQGCADAGLCYPPETKWVALTVGQPGGNQHLQAARVAPG